MEAPGFWDDAEAAQEKSKLLKGLKDDVETCAHLYQQYEDIETLIQMGYEENDEELAQEAREEFDSFVQTLDNIKIRTLLSGEYDKCNAILKLNAGAGGTESCDWAQMLYRMYTRYAESQGWKVQVMEASVSEAGGFSQIVFSIKGTDVYKALKWESGVHRVQRVPKTETQGRIHTSTATVLCQPEIEEEDFELDMNDLTFETHRASGAGGQHINKTDSAVRIVHIPTGITVNCQEGRSQIENRETAIRIIRARVYEEMQKEKEEAAGKERRAKIGTGDRSEKIRTYNYPQNRVTDHRIHFSVNHLDQIMEGKLQEVIDALQAEEERRKLEVSE